MLRMMQHTGHKSIIQPAGLAGACMRRRTMPHMAVRSIIQPAGLAGACMRRSTAAVCLTMQPTHSSSITAVAGLGVGIMMQLGMTRRMSMEG